MYSQINQCNCQCCCQHHWICAKCGMSQFQGYSIQTIGTVTTNTCFNNAITMHNCSKKMQDEPKVEVPVEAAPEAPVEEPKAE